MAVGKNKLTDSENDFLDSIELVIENVRESDPKKADQMTAELQTMINNAKFFNNANLRRIFFQKQMAKSDFFSDKQGMQDILKASGSDRTLPNEYWTPSSDADIKATNVSQIDAKGYNKDFFNWESDRHWTKLSPTEIKETADYMKMSPHDLLNEVRDEQTKRDREDLFSFSKDPYAWYSSLMWPRVSEAIMRGEDPQGKDWALDAGENLLYTVNPAGKGANIGVQALLRTGAKAGAKAAAREGQERVAKAVLPKAVSLLGQAGEVAFNPLTMELADAAAYGDDENTDRKDFSKNDVIGGAAINGLMTKAAPAMLSKFNKEPTVRTTQTESAKTMERLKQAAPKNSQEDRALKKLIKEEELLEKLKKMSPEERKKFLETMKERSKLQSDLTKASKETRELTPGEVAVEEFTPNKSWILDYSSNKTGDLLGEDPRFQNRALRRFGGKEIAPYLIDFVKPQRSADDDEREKLYDLLGR